MAAREQAGSTRSVPGAGGTRGNWSVMVALKAEYGVGNGVFWHIVPDAGDSRALCHRLLSPIAETRLITGTSDGIDRDQLCEPCRTVFEGGTEAR